MYLLVKCRHIGKMSVLTYWTTAELGRTTENMGVACAVCGTTNRDVH